MGLVHGAYCLGCCWFLMGLLFIGGIMNPLWIGGIALYVLLEKFAPRGHQLRRATGHRVGGGRICPDLPGRLSPTGERAMVDWYVEGVEFGTCSCDYGCPCQFNLLRHSGSGVVQTA